MEERQSGNGTCGRRAHLDSHPTQAGRAVRTARELPERVPSVNLFALLWLLFLAVLEESSQVRFARQRDQNNHDNCAQSDREFQVMIGNWTLTGAPPPHGKTPQPLAEVKINEHSM